MTASLPGELLEVFERSVTAELVIVDERGHPQAWPVSPSLQEASGCIDVGASRVAAGRDSHVALLLCDADVSRMVLVQGTARVEDGVRVRPERVYAWPGASPEAEPRLYDWHVEEVRSAHNAEPEVGHAAPEGGPPASWDDVLEELAPAAALGFMGPDGFPFAVRVPVRPDRAAGVMRIGSDPVGAPIEPGPACLSARSVQVLGDLVEDRGAWVLQPHRLSRRDG
jgi:hypothetical protein